MKKIVFIVMLLSMHIANGQVAMQPSLPAMGLIQKSQLWNVLVVNNSPLFYNARLDLILSDRTTGEEIMTATTGFFTLNSGSKQLNENILNPVQYNYLGTAADSRIQGLLPPGNYTACYSLTAEGVKETVLSEECVSFDVEPLSPPMLIMPSDSSRFEQAPTQFSWIPPTPQGMFTNLHYDIIITEIKEGQQPDEALEENLPLFTGNNQLSNSMVYSNAYPAFEKNKWYVWQVVAGDDRQYAGKSEAWVFTLSKEANRPPSKSEVYLLLDGNTKGIYQIGKAVLNLKYFSYLKEYQGKFVFTDERNNIITTYTRKVSQGDNFLLFNLSNRFSPGKVYTVTISDKDHKPYSLTFRTNKK